MRLCGFLQIYQEEEKGNLKRCLDSMSKYCDDIVIYDDGSTDNSVEIAKQYTDHIILGRYNDFASEIYHKKDLLNLALSLKPDWIFWLDADEVVEYRAEQGDLRDLCKNAGVHDSFAFKEVNLWRCSNYYRVDNQYAAGIFCRLWKNNGLLEMRPKVGLHQRQAPYGLIKEGVAGIKILHYGFASDESILQKYHTYKSHGQAGWPLYRLVDERTLQVRPCKKEWFEEPMLDLDKNEVYKVPLVSKLRRSNA